MKLQEIRRFRRTLREFERLTNLQLKNCCSGVTLAQCIVLLETEESGRPTVSRLASKLRLDNSTLSRTIEGLVRKKLVARRRDDRDRRVVRVELTAKGKSVCRSIHAENDAYCRHVLGRIPPSRRRAAIGNFENLVQAFLDHEAESDKEES